MADSIKDYVGDLVHHAYDAISGAISSASAPSKPAATSVQADQHIAGGYSNAKTRKSQIDDQVQEDGG